MFSCLGFLFQSVPLVGVDKKLRVLDGGFCSVKE